MKAFVAAVAGSGTMGTGIAITIVRAGMPVRIFDRDSGALDRSRSLLDDFLQTAVKKGKLTAQQAESAAQSASFSTDLSSLVGVNLVIEAIYEDLGAKRALLNELEDACGKDLIVLTNTSTLSITEIAAGAHRPERVVGAHYCLPAPLVKLVEMSRGLQTSDDAWRIAWEFQRLTGQQPIEAKDRPGFILNHFCIPYHNDVIRLIEDGVAMPAEIDRAMKTAMGFAMGPCELLDLIGLDTQLRASEAFFKVTNDPRTAPPPLLRRMVAAGQLGRKTMSGFFSYAKDAVFGN